MAFRKRSLSKPSSSRASNNMRLNAKGATAKIENYVYFESNHESKLNNSIKFVYKVLKKNPKIHFVN